MNLLNLEATYFFFLPIVNHSFPHNGNVFLVSFLPKNDVYDCNNYWYLSLTSCLGKLHFIASVQIEYLYGKRRLNIYMENNNLYNEFQAGFRPGYRTIDHIYTIKTILNKYTERKKKRRVNFIPKFHSSLKKFVKYFTMITKRYMYGTKVPNFIGL